jgi:hypothetical protein
MIIQVRGTSGSGKTTVVKQVMERWRKLTRNDWEPLCIGGIEGVCKTARTQPCYYGHNIVVYVNKVDSETVVLGPYHTDCGGTDFIRKSNGGSGGVPTIYETIRSIHFGRLIAEGLLLSEDVKWTLQLREDGESDIRCLFLATDPEECLRRVQERQGDRGREVADEQTARAMIDGSGETREERVRRKLMTRVETIERARVRLVASGIYCRRVSSTQAVPIILRWLEEHHIGETSDAR